jgi:hypothetical protein
LLFESCSPLVALFPFDFGFFLFLQLLFHLLVTEFSQLAESTLSVHKGFVLHVVVEAGIMIRVESEESGTDFLLVQELEHNVEASPQSVRHKLSDRVVVPEMRLNQVVRLASIIV